MFSLSPSLPPLSPSHTQMEEVSKKLAPILQVGDNHPTDEEDKMADVDSGQAATRTSETAAAADPSIQEKMEVREAIWGRKESVIVKGTKIL